MSGVQRSHRRHETNLPVLMSNGSEVMTDFTNLPNRGQAHFCGGLCGNCPDRTSSIYALVAPTTVFAS